MAARPRGGGRGRGAEPTRKAARDEPSASAALSPGELTWLAAVPCAVLVLLAIVVLGPPLGRVLFPHHVVTFWPSLKEFFKPEETEQARFLIAIAAPLVLLALTLLAVRRSPSIAPAWARVSVLVVQGVAITFAIVCVLAQRAFSYGEAYEASPPFHQQYFRPLTWAVSVLGALALLAAVRDARVRERAAAWTRESHARWIGASGVAVLMIVVWMLHAFNTEATIGGANFGALYHIRYTLDETFAVLDGHSPLVDFSAQYGSLWPYPAAAAMALLGKTIGVFSGFMVVISGLAMGAMYAALRRVAHSAVVALALFLPFMATAFFLLRGPLETRYTLATIYSAYPMRYAGPWGLVWLTARHLDGARPRRALWLFVVAGLVVLNNTDHGIPAFGAVLAALLWTRGRPRRADLRALALDAAGGLLAAFALVSLLTLVRAGALPDPALAFRYARLFASAGFAMQPMPTLGFHLVIYLTFVAAIGVGTARAIAGEQDRPLTGMLVWSGVFGLAAGSYYAGRSHPEVLVDSFGPWAFSLSLLMLVTVRRLAARTTRWPAPAEVACVVVFGLAVCSLAQTPTPWSQLHRLSLTEPALFKEPFGESFVAEHTHRGEHVAILIMLGHRMGEDLGLDDVAPYTGLFSMPAREQLDETVQALRAAHGRKVFVEAVDPVVEQTTVEEVPRALARGGFRLAARNRTNGLTMWVDSRPGD